MNVHIIQKYDQSWSTSKDVAEQFAYFHYQNQQWFNLQDRVVLQSKVPKTAIFYSKQECEFEIVVNVNLLGKFEHAHNNSLNYIKSRATLCLADRSFN